MRLLLLLLFLLQLLWLLLLLLLGLGGRLLQLKVVADDLVDVIAKSEDAVGGCGRIQG